jgi:hypothetical protein
MDPKMEDGFAALWTFSSNGSISFYEIETTPPGWDGGGPIDQTTMRNSTVRTALPKALKSMTDGGGTVAYADTVLDGEAEDLINDNQLITLTLPTGASWAFWGYLNRFQPTGLREGSLPTASIQIIPTLTNDAGVETLPVFTPA